MQGDTYAREKKEKFDVLAARARRVREVLADACYADAWDVYPFNSGYFMCIRLKRVDAEKLRLHLLDNYGIGLISIGERNLRIAFSCVEEDLIKPLFDSILAGVRELET
jgi:aspartate/methionine/tyrosine aminotransferase